MRVVAVNASLKTIEPVVLVKVTVVAATVPLKVVPPELVMVKVPRPEVDVPVIVAPDTAPVLRVRL